MLRACAWLAILVVIGAVAAADAVHAMSVALPKRPIEATVAIIPWAVLLIGFTLLYAMAWQAWPGRRTAAARAAANGRAPAAAQPGATAKPAGASVPPSSLLADKPAESGTTAAAAPAAAGDIPASSKTPAATSEVPAAGGGETAVTSDAPAAPAAAVATLPESPLPSRRAPERDDPSDADAAPVDPSGALQPAAQYPHSAGRLGTRLPSRQTVSRQAGYPAATAVASPQPGKPARRRLPPGPPRAR